MRRVLAPLIVALALADASAIDFSGWKSIAGTGPAAVWFAVNPSFTEIWLEGWPMSVATGGQAAGSNLVVSKGMVWDKAGNRWFVGTADSGLVRYGIDGSKKVFLKSAGLASNSTRIIRYDPAANRLIVGLDFGVCTVALDAACNPTGWTNALSVPIKDIVVAPNGGIWALHVWSKVFHFTGGSWVEYTQFPSPISGAVDAAGNFVLSYERMLNDMHYQEGIVRFDGNSWTDIILRDSTTNDGFFGQIAIDKHNLLWFSGNGIGTVNLLTKAEERVALGTLTWAPTSARTSVNLTITPEGEVMFSGTNKVLWKPGTNSVRGALVAPTRSPGAQVTGTFDLLGRSSVVDCSSPEPTASQFSIIRTEYRTPASKILTIR